MAIDVIANNLSGDGHTVHLATGPYLVYVPDRITGSVKEETPLIVIYLR